MYFLPNIRMKEMLDFCEFRNESSGPVKDVEFHH
jgi:hypothetical protein